MQYGSITDLLRLPEGPTLEYKKSARRLPVLATDIAAFANSGGGTLVIGVDHRGPTVVGVDDVDSTIAAVNEAAALLRPPISVETETVDVRDKRIVVARVPR